MQVGRTPPVPAATIRRQMLSRWSIRIVAALACLVTGQAAYAQQALGIVTGTVKDAVSGEPVAAAAVKVSGTTNGALTGDDGKYTLRQVAAGLVTIEVARIGYEPTRGTVTVREGAPVTLDLALKTAVHSLEAVVTTVTGQTRKVELANTTATIDVSSKLAEAPVSNISQLLSGRAAGVQVVSSGATGAGSRIRVRGQSSLSLSNDPLVYVDGVRVSSGTGTSFGNGTTSNGTPGVGGSAPSRFDDLNPADIATIEILKGPSAATLYGTEAANGVINITTKRGRSGKTVWQVYSENGLLNDPSKGKYPLQYYEWGTINTLNAAGAIVSTAKNQKCLLQQVTLGTCVQQDSLTSNSVLNNPITTPLSQGTRQEYGVQASGGSDRLQFFAAADKQDETGVYSLPGNEIARLMKSRGVSALPVEQVHPNALSRVNLRANLSAQLGSTLTLQISSAYVNSLQRLPQNEDNSTGIMVNAQGGTAARLDNFQVQGTDTIPLYGQFAGPMGDIFSVTTTQGINRFINSATLRWSPINWLTTHATAGLDYTSRVDQVINLFDQGPYSSVNRVGSIDNRRAGLAIYTVDLGANGAFQLLPSLGSKTSVGVQYFDNYQTYLRGAGQNLPPGATTVTAVGTITNASQNTQESITLGTYVDQEFNIRDRFFLTGGIRLDDNSAFGASFKGVSYPHIGGSWVISDEGFFPKPNFLQQVRLRTAYGASGVQPGTLDALRYFSPIKVASQTGGADGSGVQLGAVGNPDLKPEFTSEIEGGLDFTLFNSATNVELTYYQKNTRDALIQREVPPSNVGLQFQFTNIAKVRNAGVEFVLNQRLFDRKLAALSFNVTGSTNANKLVTLGQGVAPIFTGNRATQRNVAGYPLFGLWGKTYKINDRNGDGIVANKTPTDPGDLTYSDTAVFIGNTYPKIEFAVSPTLELFDHKLRFNAQFDRKANLKKFYNTQRHECQGGQSCQFLYDRTTSLEDQARAVALTDQSQYTGFFYDGSFTRFRELSVAYQMPDRLARYLRASRWNLVLTGRNLHVWTKYPGVDPESTVGNTDARGNEEYFATPPLRVFTFRMNFTF